MATRLSDCDDDDPATLHRIMRTVIAEGLKKSFDPPQKLSHELFVLMLQLKERERRRTRVKRRPQPSRAPLGA